NSPNFAQPTPGRSRTRKCPQNLLPRQKKSTRGEDPLKGPPTFGRRYNQTHEQRLPSPIDRPAPPCAQVDVALVVCPAMRWIVGRMHAIAVKPADPANHSHGRDPDLGHAFGHYGERPRTKDFY